MELFNLLAKLTLDKSDYDKGLEDAEKDAKDLNIATPSLPKPDNTEFKAGIDEAEDTGNIFKQVMIGVWDGIKDAAVTAGVVGLISNVVSAMRQGIDIVSSHGDEISKGAKNLQISTKAYQEYEYILGKSNLKIKDLNTAMSAFDSVLAGNGTKKQAEALASLGIDAESAGEQFKSSGEMLETVMNELAGYKESDKGAIIDALFGKNEKWTGYFEQSAKEIRDLKQEADDLGLIMSDETIENAVRFNEATEKWNSQLTSVKQAFGEGILPLITRAVEGITKIMAFFGGGQQSLSEKWAGDDKEFSKQLLTIEETSTAAQTLADKLLEMGDTSKMTADQYAIWKGTAENLIQLVPSLGEVIDTETGKISANSTEIAENIKQWENLAKQKALQTLKEQKYQDIVDKNQDLIEKQVDVNAKMAEIDGKRETAMKKINEYLSDEQYGQERQALSGFTEVNEENFGEAATKFSNAMYQGAEFGEALRAYNQSTADLETLETTAASLADELAKGEEEYQNWLTAAESLYGTTADQATDATEKVNALDSAIDSLPTEKTIHISVVTDDYRPHAIGSAYIPYDNYPALLHRGEKILTATEARNGSSGDGIDYGHLEDRIAAAIRAGMANATVQANLNGRDITDDVNRRTGQDLKARRFRG